MVCYADDTLVLAGGRWWNEAVNLTEAAVACVIRVIQRLGLSASPAKSEALWFFDHHRRGTSPPGLFVYIKGKEVPVRYQLKYLALTPSYFELLVPRVTAAANPLYGLLPNIVGAGDGFRRLYEGVVRS
ncbi:uncharacterized protein LOC117162218 [Bombus vancouverensis nearcticus]|uniref:uncharacterized protein LOC117162218 n=1 Tax=Bombus vancouverensis nearcticus TaxID=2705178 RepID=UPI001439C8B1|nr:uncharacterized protein LOC117162218 [Bombus vancouverensis nearcticus]